MIPGYDRGLTSEVGCPYFPSPKTSRKPVLPIRVPLPSRVQGQVPAISHLFLVAGFSTSFLSGWYPLGSWTFDVAKHHPIVLGGRVVRSTYRAMFTFSRPLLRPTCPLCFPQDRVALSLFTSSTLLYPLLPKEPCRFWLQVLVTTLLASCLCPSSFGSRSTISIFPGHFWSFLY